MRIDRRTLAKWERQRRRRKWWKANRGKLAILAIPVLTAIVTALKVWGK